MKTSATLLTALLLSLWIVTIALVSVQNAESVTFRFLNFQSIPLPFGLVLAFSVGLGIAGTAIAQPIFSGSSGSRAPADDDEF